MTTNSIDDPGGRVFASVRSGRIMHQMGAVRESIAAYESALAVAPGHTAALLGLAEAELGRARMAAGRAPGAAIASAERAAEAATQAIQAVTPGTDAPKRTAVKLIGDAMMVVARCRDPKAIAQGSDDDAIDEREASKPSAATRAAQADAAAEKAARRARRAYARAIHLEPNAACAWRDLAGACVAEGDACASRGVESPGSDESPGRAKCRDVAERCLRGALRVDAADPATWTAIGTLPGAEGADPTRDTARRETALARAVALDPRCAPAWSALGRIYLRRAATEADPGERGVFISRAQRALDNARAADPSDANAWVGTALLHSARGDEGETAGAFRMASDLGAGRDAHLRGRHTRDRDRPRRVGARGFRGRRTRAGRRRTWCWRAFCFGGALGLGEYRERGRRRLYRRVRSFRESDVPRTLRVACARREGGGTRGCRSGARG